MKISNLTIGTDFVDTLTCKHGHDSPMFSPKFTHCYFVTPRVRTKSKSKSPHVNWLWNKRFSSSAALLSDTIDGRDGSRCDGEKWTISFMIFGSVDFFSNFKPTIHRIKSKQLTCVAPFLRRQKKSNVIIRTSLGAIGRIDTIFFLVYIFIFLLVSASIRSAAGCCANLWDHRENDFASFSIGFFNHRSSINVFTRTRWNKAHMVKCWQAATGRTIKW